MDAPTQTSNHGNGAIVFILERQFLPGLKTLFHSAREAFAQADEQIVILSDDPLLLEDPFVQRVSDRTILITNEDKQRVSVIRKDNILKVHRRADIGAYVFLKLHAFRNFGFDYHIFLDADLLCLDPSFRFTALPHDCDFSAAPTVGPQALGIGGWKPNLSEPERDTCFAAIEAIACRNYGVNRIFNSGVVRIGRRLLGDETVHGLIELASREAFRTDQPLIHRYVESRGISFRSMPIWFNFPMLPCLAVGPDRFSKLRDRIGILHYNRMPKPWLVAKESRDWIDELWWDEGISGNMAAEPQGRRIP